MQRLFLLVILGLICSVHSLDAQGWRKIFTQVEDTPIPDIGLIRDVQATADGGYLLYGDNVGGVDGDQIALWKIDAYGNTQWSKFLTVPDLTSVAGKLHILGDSAIYISGAFPDTAQLTQHGVMRLNMQGEMQWQKLFSTGASSSSFPSIQHYVFTPTADGHFISSNVSLPVDSVFEFANFLRKIDQQGNVVWERTLSLPLDNSGQINYITDIVPLSDGGFVITGTTKVSDAEVAHLTRFDENGEELWQMTFGDEDEQYNAFAVALAPDGNLVFGGGIPDTEPGFIKKVTLQGVELWHTETTSAVTDVDPLPTGGYILAGSLKRGADFIWPSNLKGFVSRIEEDGNILWTYEEDNSPSAPGSGYNRFGTVTESADGTGYVAVGYFNFRPFAIKLDSNGNMYTNILQGTVQRDEDADCAFDTTAAPLLGWNVTASNGTMDYYATTDSNGFYTMTVDTGSYSISITPPNDLWVPCQTTIDTLLEGFYEETAVDFYVQAAVECPLMSVDVSVPFLRRCFSNTYSVRYCNEGTAVANDAAVEIQLDEFLTLESAELPYSATGDQAYRFELGDLPPNACGQFKFTVYVDCDNTELGQTHCVEAFVFPDTLCVPKPPAPLISADSRCDGDSAVFTLLNIGDADMESSASYIVIEDDVMFFTQPFELEQGESIEIRQPANGATYRLQAPRSPGFAPGELISSTLEGCISDNQVISLGFFNSFPLYGNGGFTDLECRANIGAYDPNDKQGFPKGAGPEHFIEPGTRLEYLIRFQNTGTDTAFNVAIRDTLSAWLAPATLTPGASSHPYTWKLAQDGTLLFEFDNIMLPDSNVNEPASHGFVKFGIDLKPDAPLGTAISNQAAIYFDFNEPIFTNTTVHRIAVDFLENSTMTSVEAPDQASGKIQVAPNPANQVIRFVKMEDQSSFAQIVIYNSNGQRLAVYPFLETEKGIRVDQWPNGLYLYEVRLGTDRTTGRFMIQR
jgi:uncharacterized repeat protein (TIGR01451 family)